MPSNNHLQSHSKLVALCTIILSLRVFIICVLLLKLESDVWVHVCHLWKQMNINVLSTFSVNLNLVKLMMYSLINDVSLKVIYT